MKFASSKYRHEKPLMHSKSDNEGIVTDFDTEELIEEPFKCRFHMHQVSF